MQSFLAALWTCVERGAWERRVEGRGGEACTVLLEALSAVGVIEEAAGVLVVTAAAGGCGAAASGAPIAPVSAGVPIGGYACTCQARDGGPGQRVRALSISIFHFPFIFHFCSEVQKLFQVVGSGLGVDGSESARSGDILTGESFWVGMCEMKNE